MEYFDRDVYQHPNGFAFAGVRFSDQRTVDYLVNGSLRWSNLAPSRPICLRMAVNDVGVVLLVAIRGIDGGNDAMMYSYDGGPWIITNVPASNPRAVAVRWTGLAFHVYVQVSSDFYIMWTFGSESPEDAIPTMIPAPYQGTAGIQAIQSISGEDNIIWRADPRGGYIRTTIKGVEYKNYLEIAGVIVGQANNRTEGYTTIGGMRFEVSEIEGEDIRMAFDIHSNTWIVTGWAQGEKEFTRYLPPFVEIPAMPDPPIYQTMPRKMYSAPFYSISDRYGDTPDLLGNSVNVQEPMPRVWEMGKALIVTAGSAGSGPEDPVLVWWTGGGNFVQVDQAVTQALALPEKPILAYLDSGDPNEWPEVSPSWPNRVWPTVQCYRNIGESLADYESRMRAMLNRVMAYGSYLGFVMQAYDRNGQMPLEQVIETFPVQERLIREYRIAAVLPFADMRSGGMTTYPEVRAWVRAILDAIPARPNRYDYWTPQNVDWKTRILNVLMQDVPSYNLTLDDRTRLIELVKSA